MFCLRNTFGRIPLALELQRDKREIFYANVIYAELSSFLFTTLNLISFAIKNSEQNKLNFLK
jgi:hypothetical protein